MILNKNSGVSLAFMSSKKFFLKRISFDSFFILIDLIHSSEPTRSDKKTFEEKQFSSTFYSFPTNLSN